MTEKQADSAKAQQAPPPEPGAQPHSGGQPAARGRPLEWQGPVFWMSCGVLLAGLAGGAVVLAQRVGIERDLMAVATTLPPRAAQAIPSPAAPTPVATVANVAASRPGPPPLSDSSTRDAAPRQAAALPRPGGRSTGIAAKHPARYAGAKQPVRKKAAVRRKAAPETERYPDVFKRCPWPGEPGAVECRRHICNGAESEGAACKPYRPKPR
ncbi:MULTISPECIES: hypothetical protein [unclassified Duganella]|uniref:hypothetical protein n=1 Tax=unclassified Duganella TaxID=2636909 RepID=UPI0006F5F5FC|nr:MULTISPECIES: hypothetical protein [unclassified Duganella]KQV56377.1 hypothetical protein ASD07_27060 [Duganella sp. Root336D2]KRB96448.1 hypothetical protein ASE26_25670 [Duganella sp. Root198D2]